MATRYRSAAVLTATLLTMSLVSAQQSSAPGASAPPVQTDHGDSADVLASEMWSSGRYRLTPTDVVDLSFPYVPEFNQVVAIQPDGYISLRSVGDLRVQGRTLPELAQLLQEAYGPILREPVITIVLREFDKPHFLATGEVRTPGRFELRGVTTVTQALAIAGGITDKAKHSQVVLFRRYSADMVEVKEINVKKMLASRDLAEDYVLRPGDTIFVPQNVISRLSRFLPTTGLGLYLNPLSR